MARIRSVKPEFWTDEDLADLSRDARLLYIGLWNIADEHGRLRGDPRYVKGQLFPYDDDLSREAVDGLVDELAKVGKVVRYQAKGSSYLFLPTLHKHQRLDTAKVPSRLPPPPSEKIPDESENFPDDSEPGADESALLYVAGSREQVAGLSSSDAASQSSDDNEDLTEDDDAPFPAKYLPFVAEIDSLCAHLADKIHERRRVSGSKTARPSVTQSWRVAAGRLLVLDGLTAKQVVAAIDWSQQDDWWAPNIESMPTLRKQFDKLRRDAKLRPAGHALVGANGRTRQSTPSVGRTHQQ